jgi:hypothetical protein
MDSRVRRYPLGLALALASLLAGIGLAALTLRGAAQSTGDLWSPPINISQSGAASQPVAALMPDGTAHVLWWDPVAGEQYRSKGVTDTNWSDAVAVPVIVGERRVDTDPQTGKVVTTLTPPREVRLVTSGASLTAFWYAKGNVLAWARREGSTWSVATAIAEEVLTFDASPDVSGTLHLAYAQAADRPNSPAGIYYRAVGATAAATVVYTSTYFRALDVSRAHLSIVADAEGHVLVTWDDPRDGQAYLARSTDRGATWSAPQPVGSTGERTATTAWLGAVTGGGYLVFWQDTAVSGCSLIERRSADGGQTWSAPQRINGQQVPCPEQWQIERDDAQRLWLVGTPRATRAVEPGTAPARATLDTIAALAAWDGNNWSELLATGLEFYDTPTARTVKLGCLSVMVSGSRMLAAGCSTGKDIWVTANAQPLQTLLPALKPVWTPFAMLSESGGVVAVEGVPALAADARGTLYAVWSAGNAADTHGLALNLAVWSGTEWTRAGHALRSESGKTEQPTIAVDAQGYLHAVWSGGTGANIYYSRARASDVLVASGWSTPVALSLQAKVASWPNLVADQRGPVLYVAYAVPFNERRGIYLARSNDGGTSWLSPTLIFDAASVGWSSADKPWLALDASANVLHAVWLRAALPGEVAPRGVYYARSTDGGQTWSAPVEATEGNVDSPRVTVAGDGQAYIAWTQEKSQAQTGNPAGLEVWGQFSPDGGQRWLEPALARGFESMSGLMGLAADASGHLYLTAIGLGANGESELVFAQWTGQSWSVAERQMLRQAGKPGNAVVAVVPSGTNRLAVLLREWVWNEQGVGEYEIVSSMREVSATQLIPLPTFTPQTMPTPSPLPTLEPTLTPQPKLDLNGTESSSPGGGLQGPMVLLVSAGLSIILVVGAVIARAVWNSRR